MMKDVFGIVLKLSPILTILFTGCNQVHGVPEAGPQVSGMIVQGGLTQRSYVDQLQWTFDSDTNVQELIDSGAISSAISITNLGVDANADADSESTLSAGQFSYDAATRVLTWSLDSFAGSKSSLADGYYQVVFRSGAFVNSEGIALDGDADGVTGGAAVFNFHRLKGDLDGNRSVEAPGLDLDYLIARLGRSDSNADLNRDSFINISDAGILKSAAGRAILPP